MGQGSGQAHRLTGAAEVVKSDETVGIGNL